MRSKDYSNAKASFKPLEPRQMVRVALVNGANPDIEPIRVNRKRYLGFLKMFSGVEHKTLDRLSHLLELDNPHAAEIKEIDDLRKLVHYDTKTWGKLNYNLLREYRVIVPYDPVSQGLPGLVNLLNNIQLEDQRQRVIELSRPIERDGVDYLKHVPSRQKFVLNGKDVVVAFAEEHGIEVPENYRRSGGPPPVRMYRALADAGFTVRAAMETGDKVIRRPEYASRDISVLVTKHRNGDELRQHHHDFVEASEFVLYAREFGLKITEKLGDKLKPEGDGKYVLNVFDTPSRTRRELTHKVELSYLPDFKNPKNKTLYWMKMRATCGCEWAFNLRNFKFGSGETEHTAFTQETHAGLVILQLQMDAKGVLQYSPQNMNPIPQLGFSRFIDAARYQLMQGSRNKDYVNETGIEILANEFWKRFGSNEMYWPKEKVGAQLLGSFY